MNDTEKLQHQYDALVARFVAPMLSGGTVWVDRPIAPGAILYFEHASPSDETSHHEIYDRLHRAASALAPIETVPWPNRDLLLIAMAAHDLVHLTDPELDRFFARSARAKVAHWIDEIIDAIGPPHTRAEALARHALLDPLAALRRQDIVAKSFAYTYRFHGRPKATSLLRRPILGTEFSETASYRNLLELLREVDEVTQELDLCAKLRALLARSPVTELLRLDLCDTFRFGLATLAVLSDDAVRGGVARHIVERGEWKAAARLGRALSDPTLHHAPPDHLYYALALCFEVQMTATLDVPGPALPEILELSDPDTARYAAVLPAFFEIETMLDEVRTFDARDRSVVQQRATRLAAALPDGVLEAMTTLVRRCQRPMRKAPASIMEIRP